jgi:hypothetical protein
VLERAGCFDEELVVAEDTKLVYFLFLGERCAIVHLPLTEVTRHDGSPRLSESEDPVDVFKKLDCYARVQLEAYRELVTRRDPAAAVVRRNYAYFTSRQAEVAVALGHRGAARQLACSSLAATRWFPRDWRNVARDLFIIYSHQRAQRRFSAKWGVGATRPLVREPGRTL